MDIISAKDMSGVRRTVRRKLSLKTDSNIPTGDTGSTVGMVDTEGTVGTGSEGLDEPKVVIDMNTAKDRKPIQLRIL